MLWVLIPKLVTAAEDISKLSKDDFFNGDQLANLMTSTGSEGSNDWNKLAEILDRYISCCVPPDPDLNPAQESSSSGNADLSGPTDFSADHPSLVRMPKYKNESERMRDLRLLISAVQYHDKRHRPSCRKFGAKKCRFNFPRKLIDVTKLIAPTWTASL